MLLAHSCLICMPCDVVCCWSEEEVLLIVLQVSLGEIEEREDWKGRG